MLKSPKRRALHQTLIGVAHKDQHAFSQFCELTYRTLFAVAIRILSNVEDAEDALIDVYLEIWRNAATFDPVRGKVDSWLYAICRRRSIDLRRRKELWHRQDASYARGESDIFGFERNPQDLLEMIQDKRSARNALDSLSPVVRRVVELTFFEDLSHRQIADRTKLALGTVKSHVRRSLPKLRVQMLSASNSAINQEVQM